MHDVVTGYVDRGELPGLVTLVSRRGDVHVDAIGMLEAAGSCPMRRDTIFRIASMTKPIAAVAAMMLIEECTLRLDEPVDRLLPELADRTVLARIDGPLEEVVPAQRPITLRDLLTMRMGFGFVMTADNTPIQRAGTALGVMPGPPKPHGPPEPDEWLRRFGTLPLMRQPGERWIYPTAFSVLGVLIARASGTPLDQFLRERIFEPLGMRDTGFCVPSGKLHRLAACYQAGSDALEVYDDVADSDWRSPPAFPDADGGLVSTVDDYLAFGQMLLNNGMHGKERLLSRPAVELMTTNQILSEQKVGADMFLGDDRGWGFGVSMIERRDGLAKIPGRFGWEGGLGTSWSSDPSEELVAILMTQVMGFPSGIYDDFWTSVYAAIDD